MTEFDDTPLKKNHGHAALIPKSLNELFQLANFFSESNFIPVNLRKRAPDIAFVISAGAELGLTPISAIQNIMLINGRVSLTTVAMLGLAQRHPDFKGLQETNSDTEASCTITRGEQLFNASFSVSDAQKAGLWGRAGPWTTYPNLMLQTRARAHCLRKAFADLFMGFLDEIEAAEISPPTIELKPLAPVVLDLTKPTETSVINLNPQVQVQLQENITKDTNHGTNHF